VGEASGEPAGSGIAVGPGEDPCDASGELGEQIPAACSIKRRVIPPSGGIRDR
jgi:hypothetical protein